MILGIYAALMVEIHTKPGIEYVLLALNFVHNKVGVGLCSLTSHYQVSTAIKLLTNVPSNHYI